MSAGRTNLFVKIAVSVMVVVCVVTIMRLQMQFNDLNEERKELIKQVEVVREQNEELEAEIERPFDEEYITRVAREKLGLHKPEEIIYYNDLN
ncbi:MAG: septum formation initiator family protein [Ruminococcaceae bacterium]|nr:septum formation initiator family protein [Oscillospiraceae bacterium]